MKIAIVIAKRAAAELIATEAVARLSKARVQYGTAGGGLDYNIAEHLLRLAADQLHLAEKAR